LIAIWKWSEITIWTRYIDGNDRLLNALILRQAVDTAIKRHGCFVTKRHVPLTANYVVDDALNVTSHRGVNKHVNKHTWKVDAVTWSGNQAVRLAADAAAMAISFPSGKTLQQIGLCASVNVYDRCCATACQWVYISSLITCIILWSSCLTPAVDGSFVHLPLTREWKGLENQNVTQRLHMLHKPKSKLTNFEVKKSVAKVIKSQKFLMLMHEMACINAHTVSTIATTSSCFSCISWQY